MRLQHVPLDIELREDLRDPRRPRPTSACCSMRCAATPSLFMRRDEVEAAWRFIDPIRDAWSHASNDEVRARTPPAPGDPQPPSR